MGCISSGIVSFCCGASALIGLQNARSRELKFCRALKILQIILTVSSYAVLLYNMERLSNEIAELIVVNYDLRPYFKTVLNVVERVLLSVSVSSIIFNLVFQVHAVYIFHKSLQCLRAGPSFDRPELVLMIPLQVRNGMNDDPVVYESPFLHGQAARIPVKYR
jgi:hypothetical protein